MGYEQGMVYSIKLRISPKAERTWEAVAHHLRWSLPTLLRLAVERLIGREQVAQCGLSNSEVTDFA